MADGMFGSQHPRSGDWETLKGRTLEAPIAAPLEGSNEGDARFNGEVGTGTGWESSLKPHEGTTGGGGTLAK